MILGSYSPDYKGLEPFISLKLEDNSYKLKKNSL